MRPFAYRIRSSARMLSAALVGLTVCTGVAAGQTFSNPTNIQIPASGSGPGPASPYPSNIVVSGLTRPVGDLSVTVFGLSHTFPADIGLLLVGPTGQTALLMAEAGSNCDISGVNLTFTDGAASL